MPDKVAPAQDTLLEFPCAFPLKIMGHAVDELAQTVLTIVTRHAPDFDGARMEMRSSSGGIYPKQWAGLCRAAGVTPQQLPGRPRRERFVTLTEAHALVAAARDPP